MLRPERPSVSRKREIRTYGLLAALAWGAGCGDDAPSRFIFDSGAKCLETTGAGCGAGELCFQGRCLPACERNTQCARTEMCLDRVCVEGNGPPRDAGGPPSGGSGGCGSCPAGFSCREDVQICVECTSSADCSDPQFPVCNVATGFCEPAPSGVCSPCNESGECEAFGQCVSRAVAPNGMERTCTEPCDGMMMCPAGFRCSSGDCVPLAGCTAFSRGVASRTCTGDADCVAIGATPREGQCRMGACVVPCEVAGDCVGMTECDGSFCIPL